MALAVPVLRFMMVLLKELVRTQLRVGSQGRAKAPGGPGTLSRKGLGHPGIGWEGYWIVPVVTTDKGVLPAGVGVPTLVRTPLLELML